MTTSQELLTNNQSITITLASLGSNNLQASAKISNQNPSYFDVGVVVQVTTSSASVSSTGTVNVYAYGSADGGVNYTDGVAASSLSTSFVPPSPTNLKLIGVINANTNSGTFTGGPFSPASAFGYLPGYWGIVVQNSTGSALASTSSNNMAVYEGQEIQSA